MTRNPNADGLTPDCEWTLIGGVPGVIDGAGWLVHKVPRAGCNV